MADYYVPLPAARAPSNAMLDFSGINNAIDTVRQTNRQAEVDKQNAMARAQVGARADASIDLQRERVDIARQTAQNATFKPTSAMQNYEYGVENPAFAANQLELKKSGANQQNVYTGAKKGSEEMQKALVSDWKVSREGAAKAHRSMVANKTIGELLSNPNTYSGTGGQAISSIKKFGKTFLGLDIKGTSGEEVASNLGKQLAIDFKEKGSGSTSDFERRMYLSLPPSISQSAAGRALLIKLRMEGDQNKLDRAAIWQRHIRPEGGFDPAVYNELDALEAKRIETLPSFIDEARASVQDIAQPAPTAGSEGVLPPGWSQK